MLHLMALISLGSVGTEAKPSPPSNELRIVTADAAFWTAFNDCDRSGMAAALAPDVEFYHDKTGATVSRGAVVKSLMDGPCGTPGLHVRRELVAGSLSYDPIPGFGAILTGRHRFYARRDGEVERLDGEARFAVVWQIVRDAILMRRVLSFAHGPVSDTSMPQPVEIPLPILQRYAGRYISPMGDIAVTLRDGRLHLISGGLSTDLAAIGGAVFQAQNRALRFEFVETEGKVETVRVRENGVTVAEGTRRDVR